VARHLSIPSNQCARPDDECGLINRSGTGRRAAAEKAEAMPGRVGECYAASAVMPT
jgi:hypothetical protein